MDKITVPIDRIVMPQILLTNLKVATRSRCCLYHLMGNNGKTLCGRDYMGWNAPFQAYKPIFGKRLVFEREFPEDHFCKTCVAKFNSTTKD